MENCQHSAVLESLVTTTVEAVLVVILVVTLIVMDVRNSKMHT